MSTIRIQALPRFPADVEAGDGLLIARSGGVYTFSIDTGIIPALDPDLLAIAGLTSAADKGIQFTGPGAAGTFDLTPFAKTLLDDATASDSLSTLGVSSYAKTLLDDADAAAVRTTLGAAAVGDALFIAANAAAGRSALGAAASGANSDITSIQNVGGRIDISNNGLTAGGVPASLKFKGSVNVSLFCTDITSGASTIVAFVDGSNTLIGYIQADTTANTVAYNTSSDVRAKPHRELLSEERAREVIDALRIWDFDKDGNTVRGVGVLAQEAYEVLPAMVCRGDDNPNLKPGDEGFAMWGAEKAGPVPYLVTNVQALNGRTDELEAKLNALLKRLPE